MFPEGRLIDILIVGAVALIVVGPKDLPILMRKVGQFMAKLRGMAAEFRASFDELARQSELDELRKEVEALRTLRPADVVTRHVGGEEVFGDINGALAETNAHLQGAQAYEAAPAMTPLAAPVAEAASSEPAPPEAAPPEPKPRAPRKPRAKKAEADAAKDAGAPS